MSKHKQTVIDGKIVYANWFLRQGEAIWDFVYDYVLPVRTWYRFRDKLDLLKYAYERAVTGFDRRISWGTDSTIQFYKRLLSDLYKHVHSWPGNAKTMREICPDEWKEVEDKWLKKLPEGKTLDDLIYEGIDGLNTEEFSNDGFECWRKYIKRVLHYFEEADSETCSKKARVEELYSKMRNPFDEKERTVVEHNGEYFYQYPSLGDSEKDNEQRSVLKELNEIDEYQTEQLKLGMAEVAKNIVYLND